MALVGGQDGLNVLCSFVQEQAYSTSCNGPHAMGERGLGAKLSGTQVHAARPPLAVVSLLQPQRVSTGASRPGTDSFLSTQRALGCASREESQLDGMRPTRLLGPHWRAASHRGPRNLVRSAVRSLGCRSAQFQDLVPGCWFEQALSQMSQQRHSPFPMDEYPSRSAA
ncbi:hypothetical protein VTK26DRAFT_7647 [Humicola hyalothermophila]